MMAFADLFSAILHWFGGSRTVLWRDGNSVSYSYWCSTSCPPFEFDDWGRASIAVDQQPGGGDNYPFIGHCEIADLVGDIYLAYVDDDCVYDRPFRIRWLYGFGCQVVNYPFRMSHSYDMQIVDAGDTVVFDSRWADKFTTQAWGTHLLVLQWRNSDGEILRVVGHLTWTKEETPQHFNCFIEPDCAILDERTLQQIPLHVESIRVELGAKLSNVVVFDNGFNTTLDVIVPVRRDGGRFETEICIAAEPGSGEGKFGPACDEDDYSAIRKIAGAGPDAKQNFIVNSTDCFRAERPILQMGYYQHGHRWLRIRDHTLQFFDDCVPCCECQDFVNVYEAIRRLRDKYTELIERAKAARDVYLKNLERFEKQRDCRAKNALRAAVRPLCPNKVIIAAGYCHQGEDCLTNLVIPISFIYEDATGEYKDPEDENEPIRAETTTEGGLICASGYRKGNFSEEGIAGQGIGSAEPYELGGAWPHYYVCFGAVQPGTLAQVQFTMDFPDGTGDDNIEVLLDAYSLDEPAAEEDGDTIPIPGYEPGGGPVGQAAKDMRLAVNLTKRETGLLVEPCCDERR